MRSVRVYVDTSVFGGTQDDEFRVPSCKFFRAVNNGSYTVLISDITLGELITAPDAVRNVLDTIAEADKEFVPISHDAEELAQAYIDGNAIGVSSLEDALHVAIATTAGADLILSWNFKHIVNYHRIKLFNGINLMRGFKPLDIRSPLEVANDE